MHREPRNEGERELEDEGESFTITHRSLMHREPCNEGYCTVL